jgi:hypothetical protein
VSQEAPQWSAGAGVSAKGARSYLHRAGPGKNSGLVVFDRWGGSILYSGIYVMYVSESTKEKLREHIGKSIRSMPRESRNR